MFLLILNGASFPDPSHLVAKGLLIAAGPNTPGTLTRNGHNRRSGDPDLPVQQIP